MYEEKKEKKHCAYQEKRRCIRKCQNEGKMGKIQQTIVCTVEPVRVTLKIFTLDEFIEERSVLIDLPQLLNSSDFIGIYRADDRAWSLFNFTPTYIIFMRDTERNVFYLLGITGTFENPYFLSFEGFNRLSPDINDGWEIGIDSTGNPVLFNVPEFAIDFYGLYTRIRSGPVDSSHLLAILGGISLPSVLLLTKLEQIPKNLYRAIRKEDDPIFVSPVKHLEVFTKQLLDFQSGSYTKYVTGPLRENALEKLDMYLSASVTYNFDIEDIFSTGTEFTGFPLTTIITKKIHRANFYSHITISGFRNEWAVVNGFQQISIWYSSFMTPPGWACNEARKHYLLIYFDSKNLPTYNPDLHGRAVLTVLHKKITAASEFGDLRAANMDIVFEVGNTTHNFEEIDGFVDEAGRILPIRTYQQLLETSLNGTYIRQDRIFQRESNYVSGIFYWFPFISYLLLSGFVFARDSALDQVVFENFDYDIVSENYLVQDTLRYPYFQLVPDPTTTLGVRIVPSLLPEGLEDPLDTFFTGGRVREDWFYIFGNNNIGHFVGLIKPELVNGRRIGYYRIIDELLNDPFDFIAALQDQITPADENPLIYYPRLFGEMFAAYLQSLNLDGLIIDIRINLGGDAVESLYWMALFGDQRRAWKIFHTKAGPNGKPIDISNPSLLAQFGIDTIYAGKPDFPFVDYTVTPFLADALKNIDVGVLISRGSASGGDVIVPLFYGDRLDGDVGNNVCVKVFGDLNGTLDGGQGTNSAPILKQAQKFIEGLGVIPIAPTEGTYETEVYFKYLNTCTFSTNYIKEYQPDVLLAYTLKQVRSDVGIDPPCGTYINGILPNPSDPTTWKDRYLEDVLEYLGSRNGNKSNNHIFNSFNTNKVNVKSKTKSNLNDLLTRFGGESKSIVVAANKLREELRNRLIKSPKQVLKEILAKKTDDAKLLENPAHLVHVKEKYKKMIAKIEKHYLEKYK